MIIWSGFGFVVPVVALAAMVVAQLVVDGVFGDNYYTTHEWPKVVACTFTALVLLAFDLWINKPTGQVLVDKATGPKCMSSRIIHSFSFPSSIGLRSFLPLVFTWLSPKPDPSTRAISSASVMTSVCRASLVSAQLSATSATTITWYPSRRVTMRSLLNRIHEWATRVPVSRFEDSVLGELVINETSWQCNVNTSNGSIILSVGGRYEPDEKLLRTARETAQQIDGFVDRVGEYLRRESQRGSWRPFSEEIKSLTIADINYWWPRQPDTGMILFHGPDECRLWHCDIGG